MTIHEFRARQAKAARLVAVLVDHGATAATAAALDDEHRRMTEELAGTRAASEATWALVIRELADAEQVAARRAMLLVLDETKVA